MMLPILINDIPVDCINQAAIVNHVPATIILSVLKAEGGKNGDAIKNSNGTIDYGVMQINSVWLPTIARYGYTRADVQFNACKNVKVATWIIAQGIASGKSLWSGVANYHSRTPAHNTLYKITAYHNYKKITNSMFA